MKTRRSVLRPALLVFLLAAGVGSGLAGLALLRLLIRRRAGP